MERISLFCVLFGLLQWQGVAHGQSGGAQRVTMMVTEGRDTLLVSDLPELQVTAARSFEDSEAHKRYLKYRRYAAVVYPYAVEAVRAWRDIEESTAGMSTRKTKKYIRQTKKEMKNAYKDSLMKLSRTQGFILIKMVERELDVVMYDLIRDTRGGFNAFTWNVLGNMYGISLKEGYQRGQDPILDMVLEDFDITW